MALTLIKEDGTGKADANSYASVEDGNAYHDGHLYASAWTGVADDQKSAALVMASRLIDAEFQFNGTRTNAVQGMQWPRARCPEPDAIHVPLQVLLPIPSDFVRFDSVPKAVVQATCEMARELLIADRTVAPPGEGLKYYNNAGVQTGYDKGDTRPVISRVATVMLAKYGSQISAKSGAVKLMRV
ncbi:MAG: hypothetical protein PHY43_09710 [Verrucomicrobiales bacterium]|nr:hypothetical protein [Verrucomicrobiales bacterium]